MKSIWINVQLIFAKFLSGDEAVHLRAVGWGIFEFCRLVLNEVMPNDWKQIQQLLFIQLLGFASSAPTYKYPTYRVTLTANLQIPGYVSPQPTGFL